MVANNTQNYTKLDNLLIGIWGEIKTGKSTFGLTFPKPLVIFDLDQGVFRALHRFTNYPIIISKDPITNQVYDSCPDNAIIIRSFNFVANWQTMKIENALNYWNVMAQEFALATAHPRIKSIDVDTGSLLWDLASNAHLERVQLDSGKDRQSLLPIEYKRPNSEMRALLTLVRNFKKNLVLMHHVGGIYKDIVSADGRKDSIKIGDTWDGFSRLGAIVDVIGKTYIETKAQPPAISNGAITNLPPIRTPYMLLETCGLALGAEGFAIPYPTYDNVLTFINGQRQLEAQNHASSTIIKDMPKM
jgi:hypothetical protein